VLHYEQCLSEQKAVKYGSGLGYNLLVDFLKFRCVYVRGRDAGGYREKTTMLR
jgi:hypothetical protein